MNLLKKKKQQNFTYVLKTDCIQAFHCTYDTVFRKQLPDFVKFHKDIAFKRSYEVKEDGILGSVRVYATGHRPLKYDIDIHEDSYIIIYSNNKCEVISGNKFREMYREVRLK